MYLVPYRTVPVFLVPGTGTRYLGTVSMMKQRVFLFFFGREYVDI